MAAELADLDSSDVQNRRDGLLEADATLDLSWGTGEFQLKYLAESDSGQLEWYRKMLLSGDTDLLRRGASFEQDRDRDRSIVYGPDWIDACGRFVSRMLRDALMRTTLSSEQDLKQRQEYRAELVTETMNTVASHLTYLEQMLNDFQGVDLREVDLAGVNLEGVRWADATTLWPETWIEEIKRDSVHLGDGVYEISYGTSAHRDSLV